MKTKKASKAPTVIATAAPEAGFDITCGRCGTYFSFLGGSKVELPFFCDECLKADRFQEDIRPASMTESTDPCDSATVENTTLLIEDLEKQISILAERNDWQSDQLNLLASTIEEKDKYVADLEKLYNRNNALLAETLDEAKDSTEKLIQARKTVDELSLTLNEREELIAKAKSEVAATHNLVTEATEKIEEKTFLLKLADAALLEADHEIDVLKARIRVAERRLAFAEVHTQNVLKANINLYARVDELKKTLDVNEGILQVARYDADYWKVAHSRAEKALVDSRTENFFYRQRGFWARLFNVKYTGNFADVNSDVKS